MARLGPAAGGKLNGMCGSVYELALFIIRNDHGAAGQPHSAIPPGFDGAHPGPFFRAEGGG